MPESLREDPRLQEVLKKAGFPEKSQFMKRCSESRGDYYGVSLELDDLRSDPRFKEMPKRLNLPE
jgi:hypothetical protein